MSWVFGPGGTTATPGGADKDIQFNNHGSFSGSALLITDGTGSLSASVNISASAFYGDGSNLTGLTASAVNVADGPEFSLQFRRDTPVSGEISGSSNFSVSSDMTKMFLTGTLIASASTGNPAQFEGLVLVTSPEGELVVRDTTNNKQIRMTADALPTMEFGDSTDTDDFFFIQGGATSKIQVDAGLTAFIIATSSAGTGGLVYKPGQERIGIHTPTPTHDFAVNGDTAITGTLNLTSDAIVEGQIKVGPGTGVGYVASNGDPDTRIRFGAAGRGSDSISIEAGGKSFIILDENGTDELILGGAGSDVVYVSGSLTASVGMRVSASAAIGEDIFVGSGTGRTLGVVMDGSDDFFRLGNSDGAVVLSGSQGVEFVGGSEGVGSFGSDIKVYATQAGNTTQVSLSTSGIVSGSGQLQGASVAVDGIVTTHRVQIDDGSQLGTDSDTDMITLNNGSDVTIASDLELRVGNLTQNRVATVGTNSKLADHSNFTFASDVLSVPAITASVGVMVTSSANGSINIGEGISYTFGGNGRLDVFENEFKLNKTNLYQGVFPEQTSNFDISDSQIFLVDTNSSVVTGTLPGVTSTDDFGVTYTIKDSGGNANTNNVVIAPSGSQRIDGGASAKIQTNYGAMTVVAISSSVNGFGWGIVSAT